MPKQETEIVPVDKIVQALAKANITKQVILHLQSYKTLVVKDENDTEGYEIVRRARLECKGIRVLGQKIAKAGREDALKEQKAWIEAEKNVTLPIAEVETYLELQEKIVSEAKERKEREAKEKADREAREKFETRVNALMKVGVFRSLQEIATMVDSDFDALLKKSTEDYAAKIKKDAEDEEKRRIEQKRLDDQRADQDKIAAKQREDQKKIDEAKRAQEIKDAQEFSAKRAKALERTTTLNSFHNVVYFYDDVADMDDIQYENCLNAERKAKSERDLTEQKRKEDEAKVEQKRRDDEAKTEADRLEALKPDKEKLSVYGDALLNLVMPKLSTAECNQNLKDFRVALNQIVSWHLPSDSRKIK